MVKVGDRLTVDGKLVEVTYVMNDKCYGYKPVTKAEKEVEEIQPEEVVETPVEAPKRRRRKA